MTCAECMDTGIVPILPDTASKKARKDEFVFAICLCATGLRWRVDRNNGKKTNPLWHVWAAREHVDHDRIYMLEEIYGAEELAQKFPDRKPDTKAVMEHDLINAGKTRRK